jgi:hypothetical protein
MEEGSLRGAEITSPIKNLSATRLFDEIDLEINIPYQFK